MDFLFGSLPPAPFPLSNKTLDKLSQCWLAHRTSADILGFAAKEFIIIITHTSHIPFPSKSALQIEVHFLSGEADFSSLE